MSKLILTSTRLASICTKLVLNEHVADRFADPGKVACSFFRYAYKVGVKNLPEGQSALAFTRTQLDRLGIGMDLLEVPWGSHHPKLPPSRLHSQIE
jgi:hypothetical protein